MNGLKQQDERNEANDALSFQELDLQAQKCQPNLKSLIEKAAEILMEYAEEYVGYPNLVEKIRATEVFDTVQGVAVDHKLSLKVKRSMDGKFSHKNTVLE
jgi:hypothetical protein